MRDERGEATVFGSPQSQKSSENGKRQKSQGTMDKIGSKSGGGVESSIYNCCPESDATMVVNSRTQHCGKASKEMSYGKKGRRRGSGSSIVFK